METEENTQTEESKVENNNFNKVTPLSKYLAMILFIIMPFVGGWIGYQYAPEKVVEKFVIQEVVPEKVVVKDVEKRVEAEKEITVDKNTVVAEFSSSSYRVVQVVQNPYYHKESKYNTLVVASPRGINDHTCGGKYVPKTCYFFLESSYYQIETPKFVGTWSGGFPLLNPETIEFISPTVIRFNASNGDAGASINTVWIYDVDTGSSTEISRDSTI